MARRDEHAAGVRDRLVTIEQRTEVAAPGYPVASWSTLMSAWMAREDAANARSDERFSGGQESAYETTLWRMPYVATMDPDRVDVPATRRLVYNGRTCDIRAAARDGRDAITLITLAGSAVTA